MLIVCVLKNIVYLFRLRLKSVYAKAIQTQYSYNWLERFLHKTVHSHQLKHLNYLQQYVLHTHTLRMKHSPTKDLVLSSPTNVCRFLDLQRICWCWALFMGELVQEVHLKSFGTTKIFYILDPNVLAKCNGNQITKKKLETFET